jgi:hypothetical protein
MIQEFIDNFIANEEQIKEFFLTNHPDKYLEVVKVACKHAIKEKHEVIEIPSAHSYSGENLYIIKRDDDYDEFYSVLVKYGTCSACDAIRRIEEEESNAVKAASYYTLALHVVQGFKAIRMDWEEEYKDDQIKALKTEIADLKDKLEHQYMLGKEL